MIICKQGLGFTVLCAAQSLTCAGNLDSQVCSSIIISTPCKSSKGWDLSFESEQAKVIPGAKYSRQLGFSRNRQIKCIWDQFWENLDISQGLKTRKPCLGNESFRQRHFLGPRLDRWILITNRFFLTCASFIRGARSGRFRFLGTRFSSLPTFWSLYFFCLTWF